MPTLEEILAVAEARAATEVITWIPEKPGDRLAGKVIEVGSISTKFGIYATTTLELLRDYVENGETKGAKGDLVRAAWMGAVLQASFNRMVPHPNDMVAFHFQKMITPQSGLEDYPLIVAVVLDPNGDAKMPVDLSVFVPDDTAVANANPRTGELPPSNGAGEKIKAEQKKDRLAPKDDETPL
jgi:hypothetical protein